MRTSRLIPCLVILASLAALPLLASAKGMDGHGAAMTRDRAGADGWANLTEASKTKGLDRAEKSHLFSKLTYANGTATGRFVTFGLDNVTGAISSYTQVGSNGSSLFFTSVTPQPFNATEAVRVTGSVLRLYSDNATLKVHNNPVALMQWRAEGAPLNLTFALPDGAAVKNDSANNTLRINLNGTAVHGHLILAGSGNFTSFSNASIAVTLDANSTLLFTAHPAEASPMVSTLHALRDAAGNHTVGAVLSVVNADGDAIEDETDVGVHAHATHVANRTATIHVSSDDATGKAIVLNLDNTTLPAGGNVTVTLDGQPVANGTLGDALRATGALVNITRTADGVTVTVSVPHFSDHDIVLTSADTTTTTTDGTTATTPVSSSPDTTSATPVSSTAPSKSTPGFGLVALVAGLGAAALVLRRK